MGVRLQLRFNFVTDEIGVEKYAIARKKLLLHCEIYGGFVLLRSKTHASLFAR